jgi:hypothetical protein
MKLIEAKKIVRWVARRLAHFSFLLALGGVFSVMPMPSVSSENSFDRIQAGTWVVASMYWERQTCFDWQSLQSHRMACSA